MKEKIEQRLAELAKQKETLVAQLNGVIGAEQALKSLLTEDCVKEDNNEDK